MFLIKAKATGGTGKAIKDQQAKAANLAATLAKGGPPTGGKG